MLAATLCLPSHAVVVIRGKKFVQTQSQMEQMLGSIGDGRDFGGGGRESGGRPGGGDAGSRQVAGANPAKDVRCWTNNSSITSQDSSEYRHGIAMSMYRVHVAAGRTQHVGSWFTVTWADGGTTSYQVVQNGAGALLGWGNERENPGDGVVKAGPVCGKG